MSVVIFLVFNVLIFTNFALAEHNYTISYEDLAKCKHINTISGYNYRNFYEIKALENHDPNDEYYIDLHLYVLGSSNAHILLTSSHEVNDNETNYEIVLGAGSNAFSEIRKKRKSMPIVTKATKGLLSPVDPLPINLKVSKEGIIEVWLINTTLPLLSAVQDTNKIELIKYISFTTWGSTQLKWFYDCKSKTNTSDTEEFEIFDLPKSKKTALDDKFYYSEGYSHFSPEIKYINLTKFEIQRINYEDEESIVNVFADVQFQWVDERCFWKPEDYDNITENTNDYMSYCWLPIVFNKDAENFDSKLFSISNTMTSRFNGIQEINFMNAHIDTYCPLQKGESIAAQWPTESNYCEIRLWINHANILIKAVPNSITTNRDFINTGWKLLKVEEFNTETESPFKNVHINGSPRKEFVIKLQLKRNNLSFKTLFFSPYFCAMIFTLSSFHLTGKLKMFLICLGLLILSTNFMNMARHSPKSYVPAIFRFCEASMFISWLCFVFFILGSWFEKHPPKFVPNFHVIRFVNHKFVRLIAGLQENENFDYLQAKNFNWVELSQIFDRILFIIISIFFITALILFA